MAPNNFDKGPIVEGEIIDEGEENRRILDPVVRLENYFTSLYSQGRRIVEGSFRITKNGQVEEKRKITDGPEALHGFVERIKREVQASIQKGKDFISIKVDLPVDEDFSQDDANTFGYDLADCLKDNGEFKVGSMDINFTTGELMMDFEVLNKKEYPPARVFGASQQVLKHLTRSLDEIPMDDVQEEGASGMPPWELFDDPEEPEDPDDLNDPQESEYSEDGESLANFIENIKTAMHASNNVKFVRTTLSRKVFNSQEKIDKCVEYIKTAFLGDEELKIGEIKPSVEDSEVVLKIYFERMNDDDSKSPILQTRSNIKHRILKTVGFVVVATFMLGAGGYIMSKGLEKIFPAKPKNAERAPARVEENEPVEESKPAVEQIYCQIFRNQEGYTPACEGPEIPKLSALPDPDKTDDLVPAQINVARNGVEFACKTIVKKTAPNEDGSQKIILAETLNCEKVEE